MSEVTLIEKSLSIGLKAAARLKITQRLEKALNMASLLALASKYSRGHKNRKRKILKLSFIKRHKKRDIEHP